MTAIISNVYLPYVLHFIKLKSKMIFRVTAVAYTTVAFSAIVVCGAHGRGMYVEKHDKIQDLQTSETSASGYIYRTDGQSPPVLIKLGEGKNEKFDAILESE